MYLYHKRSMYTPKETCVEVWATCMSKRAVYIYQKRRVHKPKETYVHTKRQYIINTLCRAFGMHVKRDVYMNQKRRV